jgi:hypothetical protein
MQDDICWVEGHSSIKCSKVSMTPKAKVTALITDSGLLSYVALAADSRPYSWSISWTSLGSFFAAGKEVARPGS